MTEASEHLQRVRNEAPWQTWGPKEWADYRDTNLAAINRAVRAGEATAALERNVAAAEWWIAKKSETAA